MSQPYIGEIRCFGFNFAPVNWAFCNGQLMNIADNSTLFAVIGTTYGGDGSVTFGLPNLQGQVPMHWGNGLGGFNTSIGQVQGTTQVTLSQAQTPSHTHTIVAQLVPSGGTVERTQVPKSVSYLADSNPSGIYLDTTPTFNSQLAGNVLSPVGGSLPHDNMQPYLTVNFCMCLFGIFPSRN
ncbi:MAG TPA: tail fiber protein [Xanthobacteraceae bacterium]|nr:tail fiber protein [Xanthobacteraceae bacterium]